MSLIVTYKGSEILNLTASAQKTLTTAGTYCEANIGIDYNDESVITPQKDGLTRLYIDIPADCNLDNLHIPLYWNQSVSEGVEVDWGDGSAPFTVSGTGNVSAPNPHDYPAPGKYVITMEQKNDSVIQLGGGASASGILGNSGASTTAYRQVLYGVETGDGVTTIRAYCFCRCGGLKTIYFGKEIDTFGNYAMQYCWNLAGMHFLGPTLPPNASISATSPWGEVPVWCKIYVPPAYITEGGTQNIPSRMPSTSTYQYVVEPNAYTAE